LHHQTTDSAKRPASGTRKGPSLADAGRTALKLIALILLLIYLPALFTSPGPALVNRCYRREDGRLVDLWEFRTECWERWQPTPVGLYLRRSNAYRLPALINVLKGEVRVGERLLPATDW
jgi:lipopolysaccharide/colanic/teichoic acid biosynthesis glycosyltransferase